VYLAFIAACASQAGEDDASETRGKNAEEAEEQNHLTDTPQSKLDSQDEDSSSCTDSVQ
jgi:hypothetical protein